MCTLNNSYQRQTHSTRIPSVRRKVHIAMQFAFFHPLSIQYDCHLDSSSSSEERSNILAI
jgi:hypothetical protein